jgi:formylglycine-generating enzyme required for sulfatase activity
MMPHYPLVYVSYSRMDAVEIAKRLMSELNKVSIDAWSASREENPYTVYDSDMEEKISQSSHVIVCATPDVSSAECFVRREIAYALSEGKTIIPLLFPMGHKPITIVNRHFIDFGVWEEGIDILFRTIEGKIHDLTDSSMKKENWELAYLEKVGQQFDHWRVLYTDVAANTKIDKAKTRLKSGAAARYLDMQIGIFKELNYDPDAEETETINVDVFMSLYQKIFEFKRVALIGDPGCGKTTTLERLAYELASEASNHKIGRIPLLARLNSYSGENFNEFLQKAFMNLTLEEYLPDRVVLLLDGLNEMKPQWVNSFQQWLEGNPDLRVIITCRKLDYIRFKLPLQRIDIKSLDVMRIYKFLGNYLDKENQDRLFWALSGSQTQASWDWYKRNIVNGSFLDFWYGKIDPAPSWFVEQYHLKRVQEKLASSGELPGMLGVVINPFLLFIVIQLFVRSGVPPTNRGQLFDQFVALLIDQRGRSSASQFPWIGESTLRKGLAILAYNMQLDKKGTAAEESWIISIIKKSMPELAADQFIYFAASSGLMIRSDQLQFTHQLLQEYFAGFVLAEDMQNGVPATNYWPGPNWWNPTGWEETAIMLAGVVENPDEFIRWLTPAQPSLAFRCIKESGSNFSFSVLNNLYDPSKGSRTSPEARAEWGRIIAESGDKRSGIGKVNLDMTLHQASGTQFSSELPDIEWCKIPRGKFQMGGDLDAWNAWGGAIINIPYDFWLAKYPVTYAQFECFVESGDYVDNRFWTKAGIEWRADKTYPRYWDDPKFHIPNHPVVGLTWYDAYAFSNWANEKLLSTNYYRSRFDSQLIIRLPTEAEWEKAGRYPDGRKYPWGNIYIPGYANIDETDQYEISGPYYLRRTTAVGIYEHGKNTETGMYDLSGSNWEWCLSKWHKSYSYPEDVDHEGDVDRVLRGGSWSNNANLARCATRHHYPPTDNGDRRGFRLCLSIRL